MDQGNETSLFSKTMNQGWIKLHRAILTNAVATRPAYAWLWITLLLKASHNTHSFIWNKEKTDCKRGQIYTSRIELSKECGISQSTVENILNYLETEHQIEQQKYTKFRLITVLNYDKYQQGEHQIEQQNDNRVTTDEQQNDTYKKENNEIMKELNKETTDVVEQAQVSEKKEFGNPEINEMLKALKETLKIQAFFDSSIERNMAKHCVGLLNKIGKDEFVRRLNIILADPFMHKNCNKIKYVYNSIKGFIEPNIDISKYQA